ncbi:hypothetical protein ABZ434_03060 [Streptomyces sp. NPDC005761]|uniref:hypothetical protein n=1 Tax=Streptomyces sp. NPDC005761 TaxID=3157066 RepID=UPI0034039247
MPPRRQARGADTTSVPYRSIACRIGTHVSCVESSPFLAPIDVPVIYESCDCLCHSTPELSAVVEVTL